MWVEALKSKEQAFAFFRKTKALLESELNMKLRLLHACRGGEFNSLEFTSLCGEHGVGRNTTRPYSTQHKWVG
jgi:hypothetical protein